MLAPTQSFLPKSVNKIPEYGNLGALGRLSLLCHTRRCIYLAGFLLLSEYVEVILADISKRAVFVMETE
jgi:hypothetical protein